MARHLLTVTEVYRADSEKEATAIINEAKEDNRFVLSKYTSQKKERKEKKEVVDEWIKVSLTKQFDDEKEPNSDVKIDYVVESGFNLE